MRDSSARPPKLMKFRPGLYHAKITNTITYLQKESPLILRTASKSRTCGHHVSRYVDVKMPQFFSFATSSSQLSLSVDNWRCRCLTFQ